MKCSVSYDFIFNFIRHSVAAERKKKNNKQTNKQTNNYTNMASLSDLVHAWPSQKPRHR